VYKWSAVRRDSVADCTMAYDGADFAGAMIPAGHADHSTAYARPALSMFWSGGRSSQWRRVVGLLRVALDRYALSTPTVNDAPGPTTQWGITARSKAARGPYV
jgi:hypothetical protein